MKIIIDIDDNRIESIKLRAKEQDIATSYPTLEQIIANGTPLNDILSKIKQEFIVIYPKNYAGDIEAGGYSCLFSLNKVLDIINKYKTESEVQDADNN